MLVSPPRPAIVVLLVVVACSMGGVTAARWIRARSAPAADEWNDPDERPAFSRPALAPAAASRIALADGSSVKGSRRWLSGRRPVPLVAALFDEPEPQGESLLAQIAGPLSAPTVRVRVLGGPHGTWILDSAAGWLRFTGHGWRQVDIRSVPDGVRESVPLSLQRPTRPGMAEGPDLPPEEP